MGGDERAILPRNYNFHNFINQIMNHKIRIITGLVIFGSCAGCGSMVGRDSGPAPSLVYEKVVRATGRKDVVIMLVPPSKGPVADSTTQGLGAVLGGASLPRSIHSGLQRTRVEGLRAYVGGVSPKKVEWALREALARGSAGSLQGMVIYTNAEITPELNNASRLTGARLSRLDP